MTEELEHVQGLVEQHKKNIRRLEIKAAQYGLDCPLWITQSLEHEQDELAKLEKRATLLRESPVLPTIETSAIQVKPCNLPQHGEFIGREKEKAQVRQALASRAYLVVIEGIGGIGKTALALEVAHELWEEEVYAVVWTTARNRELDLNDILDTFAKTLGYPYITRLPLEEKPTEVANLLHGKQCLLVVDNFETITDESVVHFLLSLPEPSKALITTRHHALDEARTIPLKGMEQGEALGLIRAEGQRLGLESVQRAGDEILLRLYQATGGVPMAIKWAVGQIKQKGQSLDSVPDSLYRARGDIFEFMFSRSWEMLSEDARRILMVMPIFATSASKEAIEAASNVHTWDLDEGLGQLVEMSLVEVSGRLEEQQRYSVHPLVRAFAKEKLGREPDLEEAYHLYAARYFLDHFAPYAGYRNWLGYRGYPKMAMDLENLLTIREWCWTRGNWALVLEFQRLLSRFLDVQGAWHQRLQLGEQAIQAAEHLKDEPARLKALLEDMGWTHARRGDYQRARDLAQEALQIAETLGDTFYIARSYNLLGTISRYERDHVSASRFYRKALETATVGGIDDRRLIASLNADLGRVARAVGRLDEASKLFEYARDELEEIGDESRLAMVLCHSGDLARDQGDADSAKLFYEEGLSMAQKTGRLYDVARALLGLARVEERTGNSTQALSLARQAMEINQRLGAEYQIKEANQLIEQLEQAVVEQEATPDEES